MFLFEQDQLVCFLKSSRLDTAKVNAARQSLGVPMDRMFAGGFYIANQLRNDPAGYIIYR
jgi:hypothetical protein